MKIKIHIIVLLTIVTGKVFGQTSQKLIFFYKPFTNNIETNLYKDTIVKFDYMTQYENIKTADIEKDVHTAIVNKDYRIIGISGYSYLYPGLEGGYKTNKDGTKSFISLDPKYENLLKKNGFKVIQGTSDSMNPNEPPLQTVAYEYAKKYNLLILEKIMTEN